MSRLINAVHKSAVLITVLTGLAAVTGSTQNVNLNLNGAYERLEYRVKTEVSVGEVAPSKPKFGGIYNLIKSSKIVLNNDTAPRSLMPAKFLYADTFGRSGRENNAFPYQSPTDNDGRFTQTVSHVFAGSNTPLKGRIEHNSVFGLDLRHGNAGAATFSSVQLEIQLGELSDVYEVVGDLSLDTLEIEVWATQIFNTVETAQILGVSDKRYAEVLNQYDEKKVSDITQGVTVDLPPVGVPNDRIYLADVTILQLDENGAPVAFDDEDARVLVQINGLEYSSTPIWKLREEQNSRRLEAVPPNMLSVDFNAAGGIFGGLGPDQLFDNATITVVANNVAGQTGETCLYVKRCYSAKA